MLYGVLRGTVDRYQREDGDSSPHLQIRVLEPSGQPWRIAVNVQSTDGSFVVYWVVDPLPEHAILAGLNSLQTGFTKRAPNEAEALDYQKAQLFAFEDGAALPPSGSSHSDDLQDLLSNYLDQCRASGGEIFAFGDKFTKNLNKPIDKEFGNLDGLHGIHNIHMNQGNVGRFAGDNGVFHDGGIVLKFDDRYVGLFLAFQTQFVPTDEDGKPAAGARELSEIITDHAQPIPGTGTGGPGGATTPGGGAPGASTDGTGTTTPGGTASGGGSAPGATTPSAPGGGIRIDRALLNPGGADDGREVIVLANDTDTAQDLTGWELLDRNGRITTLAGTVDAGKSLSIPLDGKGIQLGNRGGTITLRNADGNKVHTVTYTAADARPEDTQTTFPR